MHQQILMIVCFLVCLIVAFYFINKWFELIGKVKTVNNKEDAKEIKKYELNRLWRQMKVIRQEKTEKGYDYFVIETEEDPSIGRWVKVRVSNLKEELRWCIDNMELVKDLIQIKILKGDYKDPYKSAEIIRRFEYEKDDDERSKIFEKYRSFFDEIRDMDCDLN